MGDSAVGSAGGFLVYPSTAPGTLRLTRERRQSGAPAFQLSSELKTYAARAGTQRSSGSRISSMLRSW
jgi:hypothetical protein